MQLSCTTKKTHPKSAFIYHIKKYCRMLLQIAQLRKKQVKKTEKLFCFTQQGHLCLGLPAMNMHNI